MSLKLDKLVAEKIMGWTWKDRPRNCCQKPEWDNYKWPILTLTGYFPTDPPSYSSDMSWAWDVVEKMTEIPKTREEAILARNTKFALWFKNADLWSMDAGEAAQSICLAALKLYQVYRREDQYKLELN